MLLRVLLIICLFAAGSYWFLWTVTSTKFFNVVRVRKILKAIGLTAAAILLAIIGFGVLVGADHLF